MVAHTVKMSSCDLGEDSRSRWGGNSGGGDWEIGGGCANDGWDRDREGHDGCGVKDNCYRGG
jgi:hypothetical protein